MFSQGQGVPDKVAKVIRTKVLVNDYSIFKVREGDFPLSGKNPFTHLDKGGVLDTLFLKKSLNFFKKFF